MNFLGSKEFKSNDILINHKSKGSHNNNLNINEKIPKLNFESLFHNKNNEEKCFFSPREKVNNY